MDNLLAFNGTKVEVFEFNGKIFFNPYDVGKCLLLTESAVRKAMAKMNMNQVVKLTKSIVKDIPNLDIPTAGRNFLTESGVYKLAFKSRKAEAEKFTDWVTDEVLPTIRKTGQYSIKGEQLELPQYEIKKKTYKGEPVMVTRDIEFLSGNDKSTINFYIRENNLGRLLSGRELNEFKFENEDYHSVKVSMNILYKSDVVKMLDYFYRLDDNKSLVDEYFKNIAIENKKAGLTEGKRLIKLIALGELKSANIRLAISKEMKEEITYAISKEYVKLGFLDKPCYNLDINSREGWNLNIKLNDYYWKVKQS